MICASLIEAKVSLNKIRKVGSMSIRCFKHCQGLTSRIFLHEFYGASGFFPTWFSNQQLEAVYKFYWAIHFTKQQFSWSLLVQLPAETIPEPAGPCPKPLGQAWILLRWCMEKKQTWITNSTARGGGESFKNRKPIGEIGCCESLMAEQKHWWIELSNCLADYLMSWLTDSLTNWLTD